MSTKTLAFNAIWYNNTKYFTTIERLTSDDDLFVPRKVTLFEKIFGKKDDSVSESTFADEGIEAGLKGLPFEIPALEVPTANVPNKKKKKSVRWFDEVYKNVDPMRGPVSSRVTFDPSM